MLSRGPAPSGTLRRDQLSTGAGMAVFRKLGLQRYLGATTSITSPLGHVTQLAYEGRKGSGPGLPDRISDGDTREEALANMRHAIQLCLKARRG